MKYMAHTGIKKGGGRQGEKAINGQRSRGKYRNQSKRPSVKGRT